MDEMNIESKFLTGIISRIIGKIVRKKAGYDIDIALNSLRTTITDDPISDKIHVHLDLDAELSNDDLDKLLSKFG